MRVTRRIAVACLLGSVIQTPGEAQAPVAAGPFSLTQQSPGQRTASNNQRQNVTLSLRDSTIKYALKEITRQTGIRFTFDSNLDALKKRITINMNDMTVRDAVNRLLQGTGVSAKFSSDGTVVMLGSGSSRDRTPVIRQDTQTFVLTGRVVDSATREGISGVNVSITGTPLSTVTDRNGDYTLRGVRGGQWTVMAKSFGYRAVTRTITISGDTQPVANFTLATMATSLSGVVTTVTGTQRKLEIGNSIASINVDSVLQAAPVNNLTDLLENRVPGLTVVRGTGQPGDPARLRLRGASSINNSNDVIVVVDGVRVTSNPKAFSARSSSLKSNSNYLASSPLDLIDPNSIETIDVFKGPSAAAMYGSDAANGVVVITTKRGRVGPPRATVSATIGTSSLPGKYPEGTFVSGWINSDPFLGAYAYGRCNRDAEIVCIVDKVERYQALNDPYYTVLGRGSSQQYSASVSGGAQAAQYSFTGTASSDIGLMKMSRYLRERYRAIRSQDMPRWMLRPDHYDVLGGRGQITSTIKPNLVLQIATSVNRSEQRKTSLGNTSIKEWIFKYIGDTIDRSQDNFYERVQRTMNATTNSVQLNWTIREKILTSLTAGYNTTTVADETMLPPGFYIPVDPNAQDGYGRYSMGRESGQQRTLNTNVEVPTFGDRMRLIVGATYNSERRDQITLASSSLGEGQSRPTVFEQPARLASSSMATTGWYIEPRFNFRSRFFLMPGLRLDHNGLSGSQAGGFALPKMNTSWVISDEEFFPWKDKIDMLRLRLAGGVAGTQPGVSDRLRLVQISVIEGQEFRDAMYFTSLGNTRLQPERSTEFEGGIDLDFWRGRVSLSYTGYTKVRNNAIERVNVAPSATLGAQTFAQNIGTIRNMGHELELRMTPIERLGFAWSTTGSFSMNTNKVTHLRAGLLSVTRAEGAVERNTGTGTRRVVEGYPLWGVWARPLVGFHDADGDGILTRQEIRLADSSAYLGQPDPKGTASWSNTVRLLSGRLSINTMMSYEWGMLQINDLLGFNSPFTSRADDPNATLEQQALALASFNTVHVIAQQVNTFRLQNLSISYSLPMSLARRVGGNAVQIALQGSNIWLKSNYRGKDPNVGSSGLLTGSTVDTGLIPQPRKWQLRLQWGN